MTIDINNSSKTTQSIADKSRQRDFDDLQNEIAGRESGRYARFRNKEDANNLAAQRRNGQMQASMTALEMLLQNDPEYAALYAATSDLLDRAEKATEHALGHAEKDLHDATNTLDETLGNANQLADGRKVSEMQMARF